MSDYDEQTMVRVEDHNRVVENLGEMMVANDVLAAEVEAWKYTAARSLKLLRDLVKSLKEGSPMINAEKACLLLRELGVHWETPANELSEELDAILRNAPHS